MLFAHVHVSELGPEKKRRFGCSVGIPQKEADGTGRSTQAFAQFHTVEPGRFLSQILVERVLGNLLDLVLPCGQTFSDRNWPRGAISLRRRPR